VVIEQAYEQPLFNAYLNIGGSEQLINLALKTLRTYKNKKTKELFTTLLKDLNVFMRLPNFNEKFFSQPDKRELLINLVKREFADIEIPKKKDLEFTKV
jgi:tyrosyl-tRNA synthetase